MIACISAGKYVGVALAVVEDGQATYVVGDMTWAELRAHLSKIDVVIGTYTRETERLRTETYLEEMYNDGISIGQKVERFYDDNILALKVPTRQQSVEVTLGKYLKARGFKVEKNNSRLNVRHLERMTVRTGYVYRGEIDEFFD